MCLLTFCEIFLHDNCFTNRLNSYRCNMGKWNEISLLMKLILMTVSTSCWNKSRFKDMQYSKRLHYLLFYFCLIISKMTFLTGALLNDPLIGRRRKTTSRVGAARLGNLPRSSGQGQPGAVAATHRNGTKYNSSTRLM